MKARWKKIEELSGDYLISSHGRCLKTFTSPMEELKLIASGRGTCFQFKGPNSKHTYRSAGLLVARHFLPNPLNRKRVNWKDKNKFNNNVTNLEWTSMGSVFENKHEYVQYLKKEYTEKRQGNQLCSNIIRYLEGDAQAIEEIIKEVESRMYWTIQKTMKRTPCNEHDIQDLTQESLILLKQKLDDCMLHSLKNPCGWAIRIAFGVVRDFIKRKDSRIELESYNPEWAPHQLMR
jgi:hypothetical protein